MTFKQDALNVWRRKKTKELKVKWEELPEGTTGSWRNTESAAVEELALFTAEGFFGDEDLYPTANAAALSIQFAASADLMVQVWQNWSAQAPSVLLVQLLRGLLLNCPFLLLMTLTLSNLIVLKPNSLAVSVEWSLKAMSAWPAKEESKEERQDFQERAPNGRRAKCAVHLEELQKFRMSLHQMRSNCKKFVTNVRRKAVKPRSIAIWQDLAEALTTQHQKEVQAMHFGGIVTVHFPDPNDEKKFCFTSSSRTVQQLTTTWTSSSNIWRRLVCSKMVGGIWVLLMDVPSSASAAVPWGSWVVFPSSMGLQLNVQLAALGMASVKWVQSMQWTKRPSWESHWRLCKIQSWQPLWGASCCKLSLSAMSGEEKNAVQP